MTQAPAGTGSAVLRVPHRFCGPPSSGNGGWVAGALAALVPGARRDRGWAATTVSLRMPPPLDVAIEVALSDGEALASYDGRPVADARLAADDVQVGWVEPVPADAARAAQERYPGLVSHPFPTCFVCGTGREPGDGMRLFPGEVEPAEGGAVRTACTWVPDASLADPHEIGPDGEPVASLAAVWAALDCPGGWAGDLTERLMVLARMTAVVDALPRICEEHVVVGQARGAEGRKTMTASTLHDADGRVVARCEQLWVAVDPAAFGV